jgi:predicted transcriptional regulator
MSNADVLSSANFTELTAEIVSAYVANNAVQTGNLPALIESVHGAVSALGQPQRPEPQAPAVNPKRSVFPDYVVSLEDGRKFRSMKRHLGLLGMTPDEYRAKWGLPRDYPMVAPNYAAARSELAKKMGLGRKAKPAAASGTTIKAKARAKGPKKANRSKRPNGS